MDNDRTASGAVGVQADSGIGTEVWIGLVLVCAVATIYFVRAKLRKLVTSRPVDGAAPAIKASVAQSGTKICFAALVRVPEAADFDWRPERAAELFSDADMRWAGPVEAWNERAERMGFASDAGLTAPLEGEDVILTYIGLVEDGSVPDDRVAMRACLRRLTEAGRLTFGRIYICPRSLNPSQFGFS